MPLVRFYTTSGCRLCDEAFDVARPIIERLKFRLQIIEIMDDPNIEATYGERIPVIHRMDQDAVLEWPFSAAAIYRYLA
ncbi:glutaredoxin family protein [Spiribacter salinus]|jgi:hypothetical protein|uniref:glutaredoxin family protein n=1 Tax=Spiribacter salinus TaxID=1335746 RepID=UPI001C960947|nr:hypothetical protein [Spiribacter salinus]